MADWDKARRAVEAAFDRIPGAETDRALAAALRMRPATLADFRRDPAGATRKVRTQVERGIGWPVGKIRRIAEDGEEPPTVAETVAMIIAGRGLYDVEVEDLKSVIAAAEDEIRRRSAQ